PVQPLPSEATPAPPPALAVSAPGERHRPARSRGVPDRGPTRSVASPGHAQERETGPLARGPGETRPTRPGGSRPYVHQAGPAPGHSPRPGSSRGAERVRASALVGGPPPEGRGRGCYLHGTRPPGNRRLFTDRLGAPGVGIDRSGARRPAPRRPPGGGQGAPARAHGSGGAGPGDHAVAGPHGDPADGVGTDLRR